MKIRLYFLISLFGFIPDVYAQHVDTSIYSVLLDSSIFYPLHVFPSSQNSKTHKKYLLSYVSKSEIDQVEPLIKKCIDKYNSQARKQFEKESKNNKCIKLSWYIIDLREYERQYVPVTAPNGERILWINFFCGFNKSSNRKKMGIVFVNDGGNCFFNLKINLNKRICYDFIVNGEA